MDVQKGPLAEGVPESHGSPILASAADATSELAKRFHALFLGMETAHGTYSVGDTQREDGKLEGRAVTVRSAVTDDLWKGHLLGKKGLGVITIRADNTVKWGAIDVDVYEDLDHGRVAATLARMALPLMPCRSKSGGLHLFCFSKDPVPAARMQSKLKEAAALLGFGTSEVFPKQVRILADQGDLGSWVNMPYFDGDATSRFGVKPNGDAMTMQEFLTAADAAKVGPEFFTKALAAAADVPEFKDAPPCLSYLVSSGFPEGTRNTGLFNIAVLLRKKCPDEWEQRLHEANARYLRPALSSSEVQTVIGSFRKGKEYRYKCSESPLAQHCNAGLCRTRKYGVGNGAGTMPEFGSLTKQEGDEAVFFWTINGQRVKLTAADLLTQRKFRERCLAVATIVVPFMKQNDWDAIVARAMENVEIIPCSEDVTKAGELWELVEKFCAAPGRAISMDEVLNGSLRPFNADDGRTYFRLAGLAAYLKRLQFRDMERGEISRVILQRGGQHHFTNPRGPGEKRRGCNYWSVPTAACPASLDVPASITEQNAPLF
jgi:hypothetical protein